MCGGAGRIKTAGNRRSLPIFAAGYQTILQRLVCTATIAASSTCGTGMPHEREEVGNEFDLGFISQAQFYMGQNYNAVRNMLFSGLSYKCFAEAGCRSLGGHLNFLTGVI